MTADVEPRPDVGGGLCLADRYDIGRVLGTGATSEVRSGWDRRLDRPVAVKMPRPELGQDPAVRRRFAAEARAAARLSHPNIVAVFDTGFDTGAATNGPDGTPFIVMERLPGDTLCTALEAGPLPVPEVRRLAEHMLSALQAGSRAGVVHCDIKPGNILAAGDGSWKLGDFGIASSACPGPCDDTQTDIVMGTPAYLAPERLCGAGATECSDLFALGVVLYEALTGVRPYRSVHSFPWSTALSGRPADPVRSLRPDVDPVLSSAVDRAIDLDPARRFATAGAMAAALSGTVTRPAHLWWRHPPLTPRRVLTGTAVGAAALTASLLVLTAGGASHPAKAGATVVPTSPATAAPATTATSVPASAPSSAATSPPPVTTATVDAAAPVHAAPRLRHDGPGRAPKSPPAARPERPRPAGHAAARKH